MVGIYKITNNHTGNFYIGQSKNIQKRFYKHKTESIHSALFEKEIALYGWDAFAFEVLEECSADELIEREAYYIGLLKPQYNSIVRGRDVSEETRQKIREKLTGRKQPEEEIERRKEAIRKRHLTIPQTNAGHKKKVLVSMECDAPLAEFESVKAAAEFLDVDPSTVTKALKRKGKVHGCSVWYAV